ncbi:hypothetical protein PV797_01705 [Clostridiaceae bacterium M8S5]|nr:hypothetical protein PV797_01705 [Clostridiaceae bacterium M8S5]
MRLFHVSEEESIEKFVPIKPYREDLRDSPPLVWALNERCLPNFLTPRDCPRVTYHIGRDTNQNDIDKYFSSTKSIHVVAIEQWWFEKMKNTKLYIYEFNKENFYLQDEIAGYYVSEKTEIPIRKIVINDIFFELFRRNVELRILPEIKSLSEEIRKTSLNWSMCRMGNAREI